MESKNNEHADRFWEEKETEYNGRIHYKTFARLIGTLKSDMRDLSGLLYIVNDKLVFEDFEKDGGVMGLFFRKKKEDYEKTVIEVDLSTVSGITEISQSTASSRLAGQPGPSRPISNLGKFFSIIVNEIATVNGETYFFEVLDKSSLQEAVKNINSEKS